MGFLKGKKFLITGLLSNRSIAYGIAKACHAQGAELAFSYVGERFKDRITEFAAEFGSNLVLSVMWAAMRKSRKCLLIWKKSGLSLTALCMPLALPHAKP